MFTNELAGQEVCVCVCVGGGGGGEQFNKYIEWSEIFVVIVLPLLFICLRSYQSILICSFAINYSLYTSVLQYLFIKI